MFSQQKMKTKKNKNNCKPISKSVRNSFIWIIINSLLLINLSNFNLEVPSSERHDEAIFTSNTLSNLEQNFNERHSRSKILEKYNISKITALLEYQNLFTPDETEVISLIQNSLSVYSSTQNNHSLRSPPYKA